MTKHLELLTKRKRLFSWQKILEEQRRLKREQEEADTASRRHTGIVPTHHQFITNERFGDLLNITDNTEKRKSGIEVQYKAGCRLPVQEDRRQMHCQCVSGWGWKGGAKQAQWQMIASSLLSLQKQTQNSELQLNLNGLHSKEHNSLLVYKSAILAKQSSGNYRRNYRAFFCVERTERFSETTVDKVLLGLSSRSQVSVLL